jgi:hypothetical protein
MAVRIEKILCTVLHEAHERQVEESMDILSEGPEGLCRRAGFFPPHPLSSVRRNVFALWMRCRSRFQGLAYRPGEGAPKNWPC